MTVSIAVKGPHKARLQQAGRDLSLPRPANSNFKQDIIRCFNGEGGSIGFYGYAGEGGKLYSRWLSENDAYRSRVTLAEIELTADSAHGLAKALPRAKSFLQIGASGAKSVFYTKPYPLIQAITAKHSAGDFEYKIADVSSESFKKNAGFVEDFGLPFVPQFLPGNFYESLKGAEGIDVIYIPGITIQNPYFDLIRHGTENVLRQQLSYFRSALSRGGALVFSYANDGGIDADGSQLKAFYDDPLIHAYQKTIFHRVKNELCPRGHFNPYAFIIVHKWDAENHVLTRHAVTTEAMDFSIGSNRYKWERGHSIYISNNTRNPDESVSRVGCEAGYSDSIILGPPKSNPNSNMRLAALINA